MVEKLLRNKVDIALKEHARRLYGGQHVDIALESEEETKWVQENYDSFNTEVLRMYCCTNSTVPCTHTNCTRPTFLSSSWIVRLQPVKNKL
jgi:hypothetical protein